VLNILIKIERSEKSHFLHEKGLRVETNLRISVKSESRVCWPARDTGRIRI